MCGENARQTRDFAAQWGSSPRVRGKQRVSAGAVGVVGLIPACAGKTPWPLPGLSWPRAHPRVCGENSHAKVNCG